MAHSRADQRKEVIFVFIKDSQKEFLGI